MLEHICEWCKNPFEDDDRAAKHCSFLCRDFSNGKKIADKWIQQERDENHNEMMRRARARALCKMNNIVVFLPSCRKRPFKNHKGKIENN